MLNQYTSPYEKRLLELLVANYRKFESTGVRNRSNEKIEGFMEAGLCAGIVDSQALRDIIDHAHETVFGVPFSEKIRPKESNSDLLDIPTYFRDGKNLS